MKTIKDEFNQTVDKLMEIMDFLEDDNLISTNQLIECLIKLENIKKKVNKNDL